MPIYTRVGLEEALKLILSTIEPVRETEETDIAGAAGRILAEDLEARFDSPPFDRSALDGYAVRGADLSGASEANPAVLEVTEEVPAGTFPMRSVRPGTAAAIMTGAPVPEGCDCVVRQELTELGDGGTSVKIFGAAGPGDNIVRRGEEYRRGTVLLRRGTPVGHVEAGIIAGSGAGRVRVIRRPVAAVMTTGDELAEPGSDPARGEVFNVNRFLLSARIGELGARADIRDHIPDNGPLLAERLKSAAADSDLIVTTGGVSVGKKDFVHEALRLAGAEIIFRKMRIKPGMPTVYSLLGNVPVLSLSGSPFAVAVTQELLMRPILAALSGDSTSSIRRIRGRLADGFDNASGHRRFVRAVWDGEMFRIPEGLHSNGALLSMAGCNCLIDIPEGTFSAAPGIEAEGILF